MCLVIGRTNVPKLKAEGDTSTVKFKSSPSVKSVALAVPESLSTSTENVAKCDSTCYRRFCQFD